MNKLFSALLIASLAAAPAAAQKKHKGQGHHKGQQTKGAEKKEEPSEAPPPPPPSPPANHGGRNPDFDPSRTRMNLSDAGMYLATVVHNYVAERSVKGAWAYKDEKGAVWRLQIEEILDDTTIRLGDRLFAACVRLKTEKPPVHRLDMDFTVDFSQNPWAVKEYVVHELDGRVKHPRPKPEDDEEDEKPVSGRAAAPS